MNQNKNRKIVFIDVDGTLVNEYNDMPSSAKETFLKAKAKGHLLCIATGRQYNVIGEEIMSLPIDAVISAGGARIDIADKTISYESFGKEILDHIIRYFDKHEVGCTFERTDCLLASKRVIDFFEKQRPQMGSIIDLYSRLEKVTEGILDSSYTDVAKVVFCGSSLTFKEIQREFENECEVYRGSMPFYGEGNGELCPVGSNKGSAVKAVLSYFDINKNDSIAIGDGDNDIVMLNAVGHGVAMKASSHDLQKAAEFITDSIENDGIKKAFLHYNLI